MANYFNYFPATFYSVDANNKTAIDIVTNITSRFGFEPSLKKNTNVFYPYNIKDVDTPESIAYKVYGDSEKHWIVLLYNNIIDPQYDWPLSYPNFVKYVDNKYSANGAANTTVQSGLVWAQSVNNVHSYYKNISRKSVTVGFDSRTITEKIQITANVYSNTVESTSTYTLQNGKSVIETISKQKLTYYDYEMEVNENKRRIRLLKPEFTNDVFQEFKQIIR